MWGNHMDMASNQQDNHLDWHAGAMKSLREQDSVAAKPVEGTCKFKLAHHKQVSVTNDPKIFEQPSLRASDSHG